MARKTSRKDVGAWLGGNRGTVQSRMPSVGASSDTEAKADVGGGQMEQVRAELGLGAYAFGVGAAGAIGGGVAVARSGRVSSRTGIHLSDVPNLKRVSYSSDRAGTGFGKGFGDKVEPGVTYKFVPFTGKTVQETGRIAKENLFSPQDFSRIVAQQNVGMAEKTGRNTAKYGYITKSARGKVDPAYGAWSEARMTNDQRVVKRVDLPIVSSSASSQQKQSNIEAVASALSDAFERRKRAQRLIGGAVAAAGVGAVVASRRGGGKNKR